MSTFTRSLDALRGSYKRTSKEEVIVDATGVYHYHANPDEYMKARKYLSSISS